VTKVRQSLKARYIRCMLQANYNWGPRLATALRKRWVIFKNPQADIQFKGSVYLGPGFSLYAPAGGRFIVGPGTEFRKGFRVEIAHGGSVEIGARCVFSYYSVIQCSTSIRIGDRAMFGQASMIVDGNHQLQDISTDIFAQPYDYRDIVIANDVTTLTKCTILNSIATKSVVAANAVVDKPIPPYCTYGGVPARILDYFGPPELEPPEWTARRRLKGIPDPEPRPNTLEVTGHSLAFGGGVSAFANRFTTRLADLLDATEVNRSVAGAIACWPQTGSSPGDGGYAHVLQSLRRPADITARLPETLTGLAYFGGNDLALLGTANLAPFSHALRVILSRHRAASVFEATDPSVTFSSDWTTLTQAAGASFTIAIAPEFPGGTVALGFAAEPEGGALHVIEADGQEVQLVGQRLDVVRAAERVDVGDAGLVGDHLLRAQRDPHRLLGRQRERLVHRVGVQRLRAAEHRGERLDRRAHDVVQRLLRGERHAGGLRVEAHQPRARVLRAVALAQPRAPRSGARRGTWRSPRRSRCAR
jgi:acetyltransferase-like isoleucine patch superfamily enzyme